jgi:hypothetical protein
MEEQLAEIEQLMSLSHFFPTTDPWGQRVQTFGVFPNPILVTFPF